MGICCQKDKNQQIPQPKKPNKKLKIDLQSIKKQEESKQLVTKELQQQQVSAMSQKSLSISKSPLFQKRKESVKLKLSNIPNDLETQKKMLSKSERKQKSRRFKYLKVEVTNQIQNSSTLEQFAH